MRTGSGANQSVLLALSPEEIRAEGNWDLCIKHRHLKRYLIKTLMPPAWRGLKAKAVC